MMLIPKTDKWVLVRWHGGLRSVERAKYLLKFLPPGEELKISTVIKIDGGMDGKTEKATVLISGNERHQLELLSEPGERDPCSDEESPEPKQDKNDKKHKEVEKDEDVEKDEGVEQDKNVEKDKDIEKGKDVKKDEDVKSDEDVEIDEPEDFEESYSDWTPDSSDLDDSSEQSDAIDSNKDTSKKNKSSSKSSMNLQCAKKKSERLSPQYQRRKKIIKETVEKLTRLYMKTDHEMARFEKKRREAEEKIKNVNKQDDSSEQNKKDDEKSVEKMVLIEKRSKENKENKKTTKKQQGDQSTENKNEVDKSIDEIILYMNTMFAGLFKVIDNEYSNLDCPAEYKKVKVNVLETGDVVIADKKFYKKTKLLNKQYSEYFEKTLTPYETSENKNKCEFFEKTLTPHESDNEPLSTISKKNNKASIKNKKTTASRKDNKTPKPCKDKNIIESCKDKKKPESWMDKNITEPCKTPQPGKDKKTTGRCKNKKTPEVSKNYETAEPCKDKKIKEPSKNKKSPEPCMNKETIEPYRNKKTQEPCEDMKKVQSLDNNRISTPVENEKLAEAYAYDNYNNCDYYSDRSDDPVLISNKYETVETTYDQPEPEWIPIGSGTTLIHKDKYAQVTWKSYTKATRSLLLAAFTRKTLATHSLTGKKSPAFLHKRAKMCLDPKIVSDIVIEVADRFHIRDNLVRNIITTKCADESKMRKIKKARKALNKAKLEEAASNTKDIESNDQETVTTSEETSETSKKKSGKSTSPKRVYTKKTGKKNKKKTDKSLRKEIQENITSPEKDLNKNVPPVKQKDISAVDNNTKNIVSKNEETILTSDDEGNMVIDEEYVSPLEYDALKSIENKDQEYILQPKNTRMSIDNIEEHKFSPENMAKKNENEENIPILEEHNNSKIENKNQENIPPLVKKGIKGFKTYKNKSKVK